MRYGCKISGVGVGQVLTSGEMVTGAVGSRSAMRFFAHHALRVELRGWVAFSSTKLLSYIHVSLRNLVM